jgi:hypothetical protein
MPTPLTANERAEREYQRILQSLRNELKRDLERDTQKLMTSLRKELTDELKSAFTESRRGGGGGSDDGFLGNLTNVGNLTRLVGSILRLGGKPTMSSTMFETTRSLDAFGNFKVSHRQSLADMQDELGKGERNL